MVKFCPNCEKILRKGKKDGEIVFKCIACGHTEPYDRKKHLKKNKNRKSVLKKIKDNKTRVVGDEPLLELKPKTKVTCPECGNNEAFYEQFQTRSADEPATTFYSCTKCKKRWREY